MEKLFPNFELERYGLRVRLVTEEDAEFIVRLRTNSRVGNYLHSTSLDVEKQKGWIRNYKVREANGGEYYFIYYKENTPIGVGRTVLFNDLYCNSGSWVCCPDASLEAVLASNLIANDIVFELLKIQVCLFEVVKENKSVWKFHEQKGAVRYSESDTHYFYYLTYNNYKPNREKFIKLMHLC